MTIAALFLGQVASLLLLASAMKRHQRDLFGAPLSRRASRAMRWAGTLLVLAQLAGLCLRPHPIHWLEAFGVLAAALPVTVILISGISAVRIQSCKAETASSASDPYQQ